MAFSESKNKGWLEKLRALPEKKKKIIIIAILIIVGAALFLFWLKISASAVRSFKLPEEIEIPSSKELF